MALSVLIGYSERGDGKKIFPVSLLEQGEERRGLPTKHTVTVIGVGIYSYFTIILMGIYHLLQL